MLQSKIFVLMGIFFTTFCFAQQGNIMPDLNMLIKEKKITTYNRDASSLNDPQHKNGIHLNAKEGDGVAWLNNIHFSNGIIEFDVKGRNMMQQSFVGIAFYGSNDSTMDAIYFRPFNFQSPDASRKSHSVQYISLPDYDWQRLRTEFPNKYEQAIDPSPQPDEWFHVRVVINSPKVTVYVNNNTNPSLVVDELSNRKEGLVGFWVGNNSDGDFANLIITQ